MTLIEKSKGYQIIVQWLEKQGMQPFTFQKNAWEAIHNHKSGIINAPTGCGKTFSVFLGSLIQYINDHPNTYQTNTNTGIQLLWVTPLRALATDIQKAMETVINDIGIFWKIGIRNGDTSAQERIKQKKHIPEVLIITPESLHLLLAQKGYSDFFSTLKIMVVDEWHELIGSKRGVQVELALSRLKSLIDSKQQQSLSIWGISATIGNLEIAKEVLLSCFEQTDSNSILIKADIHKQTRIESILPDDLQKYPWAGHLGLSLIDKVIPIIKNSSSTLIFINTRGMSERWYQELLNYDPELSGQIALHHGSIDMELRNWVEDALHTKKLKAVVCTASLDLGVDFRPVDTVIQVGSPKGIARFIQRAGRSGHQPDAVSHIYFLPTHSLELVESVALQQAIKDNIIESKEPLTLCMDVLLQYLNTLAISEGFDPEIIYDEIKKTYAYKEITEDEWNALIHFLLHGGKALEAYDEYKKVENDDGIFRIRSRKLAMRHRMNIGTIVSEQMLKVKLQHGGYIGMIEEGFISKLEPGDSFIIAGYNVALVQIKEMTVLVRKSNTSKTIVPSWQGGRMSLTANLGDQLRATFHAIINNETESQQPEIIHLHDLFQLQQDLSQIPQKNELLIEQHTTKDGYHLLVYPFEGRLVHEILSAILAYRIGCIQPLTFSIAMNDYGFELLSDQPIPINSENAKALFSQYNLFSDIQKSVNASEMAKRKFRDIAIIAGLIFQTLPGSQKKARHLQASAGLLFNVFNEYEPDNLLIRQAYREVFDIQMETQRLSATLNRITNSNIIITNPVKLTPLSFPIIADGLNRNNLTTEKLEDRIRRMQADL